MISYTAKSFWKAYNKLDGQTKKRARKAYQLFEANPNHPSLKFKNVHPTEPVYSARVTLNRRAVGIRDDNEIVWVWIGNMMNMNDSSKIYDNAANRRKELFCATLYLPLDNLFACRQIQYSSFLVSVALA